MRESDADCADEAESCRFCAYDPGKNKELNASTIISPSLQGNENY